MVSRNYPVTGNVFNLNIKPSGYELVIADFKYYAYPRWRNVNYSG